VSLLDRPAEKRTNYNFFDLINSEEKTYWPGFLYVDGNLAKSRWSTSLMVSQKDKAHLEKLTLIFDGDGCASLQRGKRFKTPHPILRFTRSRSTLEKILEILSTELNPNKNKKFPLTNKKSRTGGLSWDGENIVSKIFSWIYSDALTFLERKRLVLEGAI
jgi:hypothetical protein